MAKGCASCGSVVHSTEKCPHGMFTDFFGKGIKKCHSCDSLEHATKNCPHGYSFVNIWNETKKSCQSCGSVDHTSEKCPHGILSSKKCGEIGRAHV